MAKTRKLSRKELKKDDEFVTRGQEIASLAGEYTTHIIAAGIGIFVLVLIVVGVSIFSGSRSAAAAAAMGRALELAERPVFEVGEGVDLGTDAFSSEDAKRQAFRASLEEVRASHAKTPAAALAALYLGQIALEEERWDDALSKFDTYLTEAPRGHKMRFSAFEGTGAAQEAKGDLEAALLAYRRLAREGTTFYRPFGMVHEARLLNELGRHDEARATAQQVMDDHAGSPASRVARDLMGRIPPAAEGGEPGQVSG